MQTTLSIIKPDAVSKNVIGKVIERFEDAGLRIVASKMIKLDKEKASGFYAEHEGKPFFEKLVKYNLNTSFDLFGSKSHIFSNMMSYF